MRRRCSIRFARSPRPDRSNSLKSRISTRWHFSNRAWEQWPVNAEKFAKWVNQINGHGSLCNLFMDYETIGEHQWAETGIFDFIRKLPGEVMKASHENNFITPSEAIDRNEPAGEIDVPHMISWADTERGLSAWTGN